TSWFEASGHGVVYSFTVPRRGQGPWKDVAPFVVAYVELDEGPRILTNLVDVDPDAVSIGMPVEVTWHDTGAGNALYRFRPTR
ncbi:MAG: OB-fold domain-containing protein, partial [Actinomycetota bacterium]|nr:OB-fold domain-containing protein [Actinomycetota bacterium]